MSPNILSGTIYKLEMIGRIEFIVVDEKHITSTLNFHWMQVMRIGIVQIINPGIIRVKRGTVAVNYWFDLSLKRCALTN